MDIDIAALKRQAKAAGPLMPAMTLHTSVVLALLDRVEKAEADIPLPGLLADVTALETEISRLRSLLARAGEALTAIREHETQMARFDTETHDAINAIAREIEEDIGHE